MARYAFSQTLLVHLASDLIAANYNRSFLRSPLLFTVQRIRARACVYVRVGEHERMPIVDVFPTDWTDTYGQVRVES